MICKTVTSYFELCNYCFAQCVYSCVIGVSQRSVQAILSCAKPTYDIIRTSLLGVCHAKHTLYKHCQAFRTVRLGYLMCHKVYTHATLLKNVMRWSQNDSSLRIIFLNNFVNRLSGASSNSFAVNNLCVGCLQLFAWGPRIQTQLACGIYVSKKLLVCLCRRTRNWLYG